jgi:hypothetical protein
MRSLSSCRRKLCTRQYTVRYQTARRKEPVNWAACNGHLCTRQHAVRSLEKKAASNEEPQQGVSNEEPDSRQPAVRNLTAGCMQWGAWCRQHSVTFPAADSMQ